MTVPAAGPHSVVASGPVARRVAGTLVADGLVVVCGNGYALPGWELGT